MEDLRKQKPAKIYERDVKAQIRGLLRFLGIQHFNHVASALSPRGVPDILGTIPGGRSLLVEVKRPGLSASPYQEAFLAEHRKAGALAFVAHSRDEVLMTLRIAGYEPALRITKVMGL